MCPSGSGGSSGLTPRTGGPGQLSGLCEGWQGDTGPAMAVTANWEHAAGSSVPRTRQHRRMQAPGCVPAPAHGQTQGFSGRMDGGRSPGPRGGRCLARWARVWPAVIYWHSSFSCSTLHQSPPETKHSCHPRTTGDLQERLLSPVSISGFAPHGVGATSPPGAESLSTAQHLNGISPPSPNNPTEPTRQRPLPAEESPVPPPGRHLPWERVPVTNW